MFASLLHVLLLCAAARAATAAAPLPRHFAPCATAADCGPAHVCEAGWCAPAPAPAPAAVPLKGRCGPGYGECEEGLSCVGNEGSTRCFKKMPVGGLCAKDPFWVCQDGLVCKDRVCVGAVGKGKSCEGKGVVCGEGLACVGEQGKRKCFVKKAAGEECGKDPFWVCRRGLRCLDRVCVKAVGQGASCDEKGDVCEEGLSCVGNDGNKKCFMRKRLGEKCGKDPFWVCRHGLRCLDRVCVKAIAQGESCNEPGDVCEEGLSCVGNDGNKKCFMRKRLGEKCGNDPFWVCRHGLRCVDRVCVNAIEQGGSCNEPGDVCEEGLFCVGDPGKKKCFPKREKGQKCGEDPYWQCRDGLSCLWGECGDSF